MVIFMIIIIKVNFMIKIFILSMCSLFTLNTSNKLIFRQTKLNNVMFL